MDPPIPGGVDEVAAADCHSDVGDGAPAVIRLVRPEKDEVTRLQIGRWNAGRFHPFGLQIGVPRQENTMLAVDALGKSGTINPEGRDPTP